MPRFSHHAWALTAVLLISTPAALTFAGKSKGAGRSNSAGRQAFKQSQSSGGQTSNQGSGHASNSTPLGNGTMFNSSLLNQGLSLKKNGSHHQSGQGANLGGIAGTINPQPLKMGNKSLTGGGTS